MRPELTFTPIDFAAWPRRETFCYFSKMAPTGYSLTVDLDATDLYRTLKAANCRLFPAYLWLVTRNLQRQEEFCLAERDGTLGRFNCLTPLYAAFHEDDKTFSDLWTAYDPDFETFYREWERVVETYGDCHGIKGRPGQPPNFFCISCVPWLDYTGYSTHTMGEPALFPIITFGKYTEEVGRLTLPATVTIAHAASDGYHTSQLFRRLQEQLDAFGGMM